MRNLFVPFLCIGTALTIGLGCSPDKTAPDASPDAALSVGCPHEDPFPMCAPFVNYPVVDASGATVASVQVMTHPGFLLMSMNLDGILTPIKSIYRVSVYSGSPASAPLLPSGDFDLDAFQTDLEMEEGAMICGWTYTGAPASFPGCNNFIMRIELATFDYFGTLETTEEYWVGGTPLRNGYVAEYCSSGCPVTFAMEPIDPCQNILPGVTPSCVSLGVDVTIGTAASYLWSTGSTAPTLTACPTASTSYSVTVTGTSGATDTATFDVVVLSSPCGPAGDRIQICHYPPGGGGVGSTQCKQPKWVFDYLDANGGIPALVPGASGITMGPCGAPIVPCL
jgi:hypothetical protein